jgi:hypothetical protein
LLQRSLLEAVVMFLSQVSEIVASNVMSPSNKLLLSLRTPVATVLLWLLVPAHGSNFSTSPLYDIYPGLLDSPNPLADIIDKELRFSLCGVLRDYFILELKMGESEPTESDKDEQPM